ncbi:MAG: hypothetical protein ACI4OW_00470 [Alphaproteobacteria bacterium]
MDDNIFNNNGMTQGSADPNRPKLKKVKRPVKKLVSNPNGTPVPPRAPGMQGQNFQQRPSAPSGTNFDGDFNLDEFLDGGNSQPAGLTNVPALNENKNVFNNESDFTPQFLDEQDLAAPQYSVSEQFAAGSVSTKIVAMIGIAMFIVGFGLAKLFFTQETIVRDGLQGVVINPEVPRGRARCGIAERTQGCVLYIMNPQRQELNARDFYDLASQLTGRQRFVIETGNMRYSNIKIKPGSIAQLNIPPLQ